MAKTEQEQEVDVIIKMQAEIDRLNKALEAIAIDEFSSVEDLRWVAKKALKGD